MDGPYGYEAVLIVIAFLCFIGLVVMSFFVLTLQRALARCEPSIRTMSPGQVWMLLIPIFNLAWIFVVVNALADSLHREYTRRGIPVVPSPGKTMGYAYAILTVVSAIPFVGMLTGLIAFVCWILYWVEIAKYSGRLALPA